MKCKVKIYVETSVVSYYTGRASRDVVIAGHQQATQDFWPLLYLNNPFTKMMIRQAVENAGFACPEIVSPDAFLGDEQ
jgi:hypothetical protein